VLAYSIDWSKNLYHIGELKTYIGIAHEEDGDLSEAKVFYEDSLEIFGHIKGKFSIESAIVSMRLANIFE